MKEWKRRPPVFLAASLLAIVSLIWLAVLLT